MSREQYLLFVASHPRSGTHLCLDTIAACMQCNVCMYSWDFQPDGGRRVHLFHGQPPGSHRSGPTLCLVKSHALPHQVNWALFNVHESGFTPFMRAIRLGTCYVRRDLHDTLVSCWHYYRRPHVATAHGVRLSEIRTLSDFLRVRLPEPMTVPYGKRNRVSGQPIHNIVDRLVAHRMAWEASGSRAEVTFRDLLPLRSRIGTQTWLRSCGLHVLPHRVDKQVFLGDGTAVEPRSGKTGDGHRLLTGDDKDYIESRIERARQPFWQNMSGEYEGKSTNPNGSK